LLATGADPVRLDLPGASDSAVRYLRTYADSRALVAQAANAKRVVILGGSFIGLEVAAALRTRGVAVDVVALEKQPLERVFGPELGGFIRRLHETNGVQLHLEDTVVRLEGRNVVLRSGATIEADFVVLGVGVRPSVALAEQAGLKMDRGVLVDQYLETSVPGIFAAGDIARWPDVHSGERIRVEHWVVAERQGQTAAWNMLGQRRPFDAVPFFWTSQYGLSIRYVGHAEKWDRLTIEGRLEDKDCAITYLSAGLTRAVATIARDLRSLEAEVELESRA
jgi:NADPH-dependent 2,4-dienoyl-CoA reductase/sulfur reductase-like enzyme